MTDLLLLSLPNSGSTWLCHLIAEHREGRYSEEFFNPVFSETNELLLRDHIGSELVSCYRNIAQSERPGFDEVIRETWGNARYTFTKENYSPFKVEAFARHFKCVVLLRSTLDVFPPSRVRVWSFYEHAWFALKEAGHPLHAVSTRGRAIEAHAIMSARQLKDAVRLGVPILHHHELFDTLSEVRASLERCFGGEGWEAACAADIVRTRRPKHVRRQAHP